MWVSDREQVSQLLLQDTQTPYEGEYKAYEECQKAMTFVETNSAFSEERPGQTTFFSKTYRYHFQKILLNQE